jgi:Na+/H+ antiporter NhaD/arsenite permease-like protein
VLIVADRWIGLGWCAMLAGTVLCILDGSSPEKLLARVDANLLLFFSGLFVVVAGFNATGVPEALWTGLASAIDLRTFGGLLLYSIIIIVGSNTVSNVPLVLLLAPKIASFGADATLAWVMLAYVSTVAGNLTLLGSVANLIVAERCKDVYPLRFGEYLRMGAPSTIVLCALGVPVVLLFTNATT